RPDAQPASQEQVYIRAYRQEDLPRMRELLEEEARRHPVCVRRGPERWREILEPGESGPNKSGSEAAVYERDGEVEGYLIYRQRGSGEGSGTRLLKVPELISSTIRARDALLSFMAAYDPLEWRVRHDTSRGEPLHPFLESSHVEARVQPGKMLRLVDVEGALSLLSRPSPEPLVLEVTDDAIPENAGAYTVGEGKAVREAAAPERVALDVRQLAQLYAGYLSAGQLHRRGLIEPRSRRALELLEEIFPAADPWVFPLDHF
ncbi:MAG: sterol carrier protein domain-containing protein, partial [Rubrobacter sp.]|nr:sterol carrier protein domain-containing protein [Rubrobacter sp.]